MATAIEKKHMAAVAELGCLMHPGTPAHVHHIRAERKKDNFLVIPLCHECHLGVFSIHKSKRQFELIYGDELDLLSMTIERLTAGRK